MAIDLSKPPIEEPTRRVFYIDVGDLTIKEAKKLLKEIKVQLDDNRKLARR